MPKSDFNAFELPEDSASLRALVLELLSKSDEQQRCVDEQNHVVDDKFCANQPQQQPGQSLVFVPPYRYYYGGTGSYSIGSVATGGGYTRSSGASYATSTSRGGFGSSFSGGSGGEGGDAAGS